MISIFFVLGGALFISAIGWGMIASSGAYDERVEDDRTYRVPPDKLVREVGRKR